MPKRSYEEKMEHYMKKMKKLKDKHKKRRLEESFSSSDHDVEQGDNQSFWDYTGPPSDEAMLLPDEPEPLHRTETAVLPGHEETTRQNDTAPPPSTSQPTPVAQAVPTPVAQAVPAPMPPPLELPLDPEILLALGESTDQEATYGEDIHGNLSQLWQPLLKKGMSKEHRDKTPKQYLVPGNCRLLQAPSLNIEISAAIAEMVRLRDKKAQTNQQQLGAGITAVSRAMTSLLTSDNKVDAIKTLSDGCRILCDLHHSETQLRIKMISPGLAKPFLTVVQDSERDETLFGASLQEKIKASKTIEKQGLQIKKTVQSARPNPVIQPQNAPARQQFQGNWAGPSRYPTRGGRGGQKKFTPSARRPASAIAAAQPRAYQNRARAPTRP